MKNINFGKQEGFRHKGNLQPKQTKKQIKREQRMQKRVLSGTIAAQNRQSISMMESKMLFPSHDDALLFATCLLIKRRRF